MRISLSRMLKIKGKFEWWQKKRKILCLKSCRKERKKKAENKKRNSLLTSAFFLVWVSLILSWWLLLCHESGKWIFCAFYASRARLPCQVDCDDWTLCVGRITRKMKHKTLRKHDTTWQWIWNFKIPQNWIDFTSTLKDFCIKMRSRFSR